jgi:hypothetical protein
MYTRNGANIKNHEFLDGTEDAEELNDGPVLNL